MSGRGKWFWLLPVTLLLSSLAFGGTVGDGAWLKRVSPEDHDKANPYTGQPDAIPAGRRVFLGHCSHCHGENAEGNKKHPALTSDRVQQQATDGDLHWLLVNGSMSHGMPPWSKLGDPQIWQVISYLKSLR
jgi:mono/diheme cytochrome c family protein